MCKIIEDIVKEAEKANSIKMALIMLKDGELSFEKIAIYSGLTVKEVEELANSRSE